MEERAIQKRRAINLGIKTTLQLRYLKLIVAAIVAVMIVVAITFYATFHLTLSTAQLGRYAEARLGEVFAWMNWLLVVECVVFALIGGFLSLKLTHKVAGPLYRMEKMIQEAIAKGTAEEIKIRQGDELHNLVTELNSLINKISKR
jgi:hypothetical protein